MGLQNHFAAATHSPCAFLFSLVTNFHSPRSINVGVPVACCNVPVIVRFDMQLDSELPCHAYTALASSTLDGLRESYSAKSLRRTEPDRVETDRRRKPETV